MDFPPYDGTPDYIASPALSQIVNVAVGLGRPLLVRGEPGTGKTLLAHSIAEALGLELHAWHVKSTSKAREGLYTYDTVQRLNDSRFQDRDVSDIRSYIRHGALGEAFASERPSVVLIDEIDKADIEFPNDLLHELDAMRFAIHETGDEIAAVHRPVVVITSNAEKELPDAFLRRCVFHYIAFPDQAMLTEILKVHFPTLEEDLLSAALIRFLALRDVPELRKRPSTSELVDWVSALNRGGIDPALLANELPFLGTLLKKEQDIDTVTRRARGR
jgi:MoxR-like ATPase